MLRDHTGRHVPDNPFPLPARTGARATLRPEGPAALLRRASNLAAGPSCFALKLPRDRRLVLILATAGAAVTIDLDRGVAHVDLEKGGTRG